MFNRNEPHKADRILLLISPDPRKRFRGIATVDPRYQPENKLLIIDLLKAGFLEGVVEDDIPTVTAVTWKGLDLYNACRGENVRIRLRFQCGDSTSIERIYALAIQLYATYGRERVRRSKWYK